MRNEKIAKWIIGLPSWSLTLVVVLAIFYLTLVPHPLPDNDIELFPHADKVVHAIMFGGLYFVTYLDRYRRGLRTGGLPLSGRATGWIVVSVIVFGGLIEIAQGAMGAGRSADIMDFLADTVGVLLSWVVSPKVTRWIL